MGSRCVLAAMVFVCTASSSVFSQSAPLAREYRRYIKDLNSARSDYIGRLDKLLAKTRDDELAVKLEREAERVESLLGDDGGTQDGVFSAEELAGVDAIFMFVGGSRRLRLDADGSLLPAKHREHFWQVTNGSLEFLSKDKKVTSRWSSATSSKGGFFACAQHKGDGPPVVLYFSKGPK